MQREPFPIVGIGASAGGLEAFTALLEHLPADTGMGFVFIAHLDPLRESELALLLARKTSMPTHEAADNLRVMPNNVYVIAPNTVMTIGAGTLNLTPRVDGRRSHHVIDTFFESLATDQAERSIGVVLSGTASDGTLGLEAIKAEGGITFAQDATARYDSMPHNAIASGCVDFVMSPADIAHELARLASHPFIRDALNFPPVGATGDHDARPEEDRQSATAHQDDDSALPSGGSGTPTDGAEQVRGEAQKAAVLPEDEGFRKILMLLHKHSGVDFSLYKSTTIQRRIARRMVLTKHLSFSEYAEFLRHQPLELDTLYSDVLISVTSFFRNPEAFEVLKQIVFPQLLNRKHDGLIRIWVLGCSTGQEAYSVGMALMECLDSTALPPQIQIFATDLNESLLEKARAGLYMKSLAADLSPDRLRKFFVEEPNGYRVIKQLREMVVFARQNLISDPPFSRIDLISCRNLLIYLDPSLQRKIIGVFHYALKPGGFLFLGASESTGQSGELFDAADAKHKIFVKKAGSWPLPGMLGARLQLPERSRREHFTPDSTQELRMEMNAQREADRLLVNAFAPPGVLIDEENQILQFRGTTSRFLRPPSGRATFNILKMARRELMLPLQAAISRARRENNPVRTERIKVDGAEGTKLVDIQVIPLKNLKERHFLVLFETPSDALRAERAMDITPTRAQQAPAPGGDVGNDDDAAVLRQRLWEAEQELAQTRDYLVTVQEQSDATHEELQASNEEAQSANEELQSINEELQTSKEELESTNEELTTVNDEMAARNVELGRINADLNNLHVSIHTAILVLGRNLTVRRFTPLAERAFNLLGTDVGRPISGIRHNLFAPNIDSDGVARNDSPQPLDLEDIARAVIDGVRFREREVQDREGTWYSLRARPYMTLDNRIDGAVLALVDIDALKRSEQQAAATLRYAQATFDAMRDSHLVLTGDLRVKTANAAFYRTFGVGPAQTEGRLVYDLDEGQWNIATLRTLLEEVLRDNSHFDDFEVTHGFQRLGKRVMLLSGRRWRIEPGAEEVILLSIVDVTERRAEMLERRESEARFRLLAETMPQKMFTANAQGEIDYCNPQWVQYSGLACEALHGWGWTQVVHPEELTRNLKEWKQSILTHKPFVFEHRLRRADGDFRWHVTRAVALTDGDRQVRMWICTSTDIHDVKESDQRKDEFLATLAHELRNPLAPIGNALQILQHTNGAGEAGKSAIDILQRQFAHAVRLMDDLLDINRISRGKITLHRVRMDLTLALKEAVEAARVNTERLEQTLTVVSSDEPIYIDADPSRLVQIIGNLLNNASKFSDRHGQISIKVSREGGQAEIRVKDNGLGLAGNQLRRIFDMFVQVDTSLERAQGGLGIGLTLVRKLVEMHGGTIEASSAGIGQGSEFVVRLPAAAAAPAPAPAEYGLSAAGTKRRILVVDDNVDSAESLSMLLQIAGHEVHTVHDGLSAVTAAAELEPDVILLDIGLPGINGYEAGRRIREQRSGKPLTLIALTGWGQETDRARSRASGFDVHLVKPVDPEALGRVLASP